MPKTIGQEGKSSATQVLLDALAAAAVRAGREQAAEILAERAREKAGLALVPPGSRGLLIAEGDSWFSYPTPDILQRLRDAGFEVASDAAAGDPIQDMVSQLPRVQRLIERQTREPRAVLVSGGGNDIVKREAFLGMLNRADSAQPGWNEDALKDLIYNKIGTAYARMIGSITAFCVDKWGKSIPILVHGYSHPVPDGRKAYWKGPWLMPVFIEQGYDDGHGYADLARCTPLAAIVIDRLNTMLSELPTTRAIVAVNDKVRYIDLRPELSSALPNEEWKGSWDNEMHPTRAGFARITQRFIEAIP